MDTVDPDERFAEDIHQTWLRTALAWLSRGLSDRAMAAFLSESFARGLDLDGEESHERLSLLAAAAREVTVEARAVLAEKSAGRTQPLPEEFVNRLPVDSELEEEVRSRDPEVAPPYDGAIRVCRGRLVWGYTIGKHRHESLFCGRCFEESPGDARDGGKECLSRLVFSSGRWYSESGRPVDSDDGSTDSES